MILAFLRSLTVRGRTPRRSPAASQESTSEPRTPIQRIPGQLRRIFSCAKVSEPYLKVVKILMPSGSKSTSPKVGTTVALAGDTAVSRRRKAREEMSGYPFAYEYHGKLLIVIESIIEATYRQHQSTPCIAVSPEAAICESTEGGLGMSIMIKSNR